MTGEHPDRSADGGAAGEQGAERVEPTAESDGTDGTAAEAAAAAEPAEIPRGEPDVAPIRVEGLRKRYGEVLALDDVDVTVDPGTFHCLVGPNGSGKTTLLRTLLGLVEPTLGDVSVPDVRLGTAFQRPSHYGDLTVDENLGVFGTLADADPDWSATVRDRLGLDVVGNRIAAELSGGYARKLDLALALQKEPAYLLLDEPLGDLDDVTKIRLLEFLGDYRDAGHGVVVSTHNLSEFAAHVDHLTIVYDGNVLFDAPREGIDLADDELQEFYVEQVLTSDAAREE